jgi:acetyltransferase-like isoleucine patch superfamily enzyme
MLDPLPIPLRRARSALLRLARSTRACARLWAVRLANDGVQIASGTFLGAGASVRVTDGGTLRIAGGCSIGAGAFLIVEGGMMTIGPNTFVGAGCILVAREAISIGASVLIAEYVTIRDQDHRIDSSVRLQDAGFDVAAIVIDDGAWLGSKSSVLRGSIIGAGAVIGAHALVRGKIGPGMIAVGAPAREVRARHGRPDASP